MDVSLSLKIGDQGLVEFALSSWTYLLLFGLCYAFALCHSVRSCALPSSVLFHALFLSPIQAHNVVPPEDCRGNIVSLDGAQEKSMKQEGSGQGTTFERMT